MESVAEARRIWPTDLRAVNFMSTDPPAEMSFQSLSAE
jgi:hypothetical protein